MKYHLKLLKSRGIIIPAKVYYRVDILLSSLLAFQAGSTVFKVFQKIPVPHYLTPRYLDLKHTTQRLQMYKSYDNISTHNTSYVSLFLPTACSVALALSCNDSFVSFVSTSTLHNNCKYKESVS